MTNEHVVAAATATADILKLTEQIEAARARRGGSYLAAARSGLTTIQISSGVRQILIGQGFNLSRYPRLGISHDSVSRAIQSAQTLDNGTA